MKMHTEVTLLYKLDYHTRHFFYILIKASVATPVNVPQCL